jgi:predicted nuclease of predicted toxin-antitoxin system
MAGILRGADLKVEVHDQHLAQDAPDPEWLAFAGKNNWIVITRDERIRYRVAEKQAIRRAKVRAFVLAAQGNLRAETLAENFLKALPKIRRLVEKEKPPFGARFHVAAMLTCCSSDPAHRHFALQLPFPESGRSGSSALQFVGA